MGQLTFLLTVPGGLLVGLLFPTAFPEDSEQRADLAVTLGIVFWLVMYVLVRVLWHLWRRSPLPSRLASSKARELPRHIALTASERLRGWSPAQAWGVAWRAQLVHLTLYAAVPALWEAGRIVMFVALLPLTILGPGNKGGPYDGTLDHLQSPSCWTFVSFCPGPYSVYLHRPVVQASECTESGKCPPGQVRVRDQGGWIWKLCWLTLTLTWIIRWRRGLQRRKQAERH